MNRKAFFSSILNIDKKSITLFLFFTILSLSTFSQTFQDDCNPTTFIVDTVGNEINWQQFPDFTVPFTVVYHGDAPSDSLLHPLSKGFSHIAGSGWDYIDTIWPAQRAYTWVGIPSANGPNEPWREIKSPWGNDLEGYRLKWDNRLKDAINNRYKYIPESGPNFDIVIADIEQAIHTDVGILTIKNDLFVPIYYQNLSDSAFIAEYKLAMAELYSAPLKLAKDSLHADVQLSAYSETPIRRTWWGIFTNTWESWSTDSTTLDYLMNDSSGILQSDFYNLQNILTPSIYNLYNVSQGNDARKYLAYNLFMIEANKEWSTKDQLVYCWLNYHPCCSQLEAIEPWMAEATAIFPLMNGANGLYPWIPSSYDTYEYFIYGLYRLSDYSNMFNGNQIYVIPEPAYESFFEGTPIWRGVVNDDKILIAAQNPFANPTDTTLMTVSYEDWNDTIGLIGTEVFLCEFDLDITGTSRVLEADVDNIKIFPNPTTDKIIISGQLLQYDITVYDINGKLIHSLGEKIMPAEINMKEWSKGTYIFKLENKENGISTKKIIKN